MYEGSNVLVTGGTGMIGQQLTRLLLDRGANVRVASLDPPSRAPDEVDFRRGNLMHADFCKEIVEGIDHVFHLAGVKGSTGIGQRRAASFMTPLLAFNTLMMEAAHKADVDRYLYTSSVAVYPPAQVFEEEDAWSGPPHEADKYAAWAKRMGELLAEAYQEEFGWDEIATVRPANVYGPWDNFDPETAMVIPALISRIARGEDPLTVWGDGSAKRDFIFSRDVARGMLLALEEGADGSAYNLGGGDAISIRELVDTLLEVVPESPDVEWDTDKPTGEAIRRMDMTRAREKLGFEPQVSLEEGLQETVDWFHKHRADADDRYDVFEEDSLV